MAYIPPQGFMDDLDQADRYLKLLTQLLTFVHCYIRMKRLHQEELDAAQQERDAAQQEMARPPRKRKRYWVSPYLQARPDQGHYIFISIFQASCFPDIHADFTRSC